MKLSRREWISLNSAVLARVAIGPIGVLISSCVGPAKYAKPDTQKTYVYPKLPGKKIQAPEHGCLIGFHSYDFNDKGGRGYSYLMDKVGIGPKILVPPYDEMMSTYTKFRHGRQFNVPEKMIMHDKAYHYFFGNCETPLAFVSLDELPSDKSFVRYLKEYAKNITKLERPMFFTVMEEQNGDWYPWGKQAKAFKKAWKFIHKVFDDEGANEYTTWIWETFMHLGNRSRTNPPDMYYPGDDYVDWIGISVHKQAQYDNHNKPFSHIVSSSLTNLHRSHPEKPIIISELGATQNNSQASWFTDAFNSIRRHPEIKGAVIWDNIQNVTLNYPHLLTENSYAALKEVFKDPYFIGIR